MNRRIRTEAELAAALYSRGDLYTSIVSSGSGGHPVLAVLILIAAALVFLLLHFVTFREIYAVQYSRLTGDYTEAEARVLSVNKRTFRRQKHEYGRHGHNGTRTVTETEYTTEAEAPDGTFFIFRSSESYGREGDTFLVKYVRDRPDLAYAADYQTFSIFVSGMFLFFSGFMIFILFRIYRSHRLVREVLDRNLYLRVSKNGRYDTRQVRSRHRRYETYAPYYQYTLPNGNQIQFRGRWSQNNPEEDTGNEYRVYMLEPENPNNQKFFILEVPDSPS